MPNLLRVIFSGCWILRACLELLAGERSSSYTLDWKPVLSSSWEGCPLRPSVQLREGRTWISEGGRGHLPSQPDQPNQPWRSMGWQMSQPDRPHIRILNFVKCFFCIYWDDHMILFFHSINVMYHTSRSVYAQSFLHPWDCTWSWWMILFMCYSIQFAIILLRIFAPIFIRVISL